MATEPDPYRMLGLPPTATVAEVKAAYRRLAKANHPDAAGEAALPRFLAIQAAYERLVGPTPGRVRGPGAPAAPRQPWQADPDRSNATHRAYGGRARRPAASGRSGTASGTGAGAKAGPPPGASRPPREGASGAAGTSSAAGATGAAGTAGTSGTAGTAGTGRTSRPKKATLGSTSYDGVERETFEPDWGGANWYGTTSGTYWTINPKEYADPRKHGPEYQARARRATRAGANGPEDTQAGPDSPAEGGPGVAADPVTTAGTAASDIPRHTTSSWWDSTSGPGGTPRDEVPDPPRTAPRPRPAAPPSRMSASTPIEPSPSLGRIGRALTVGAPPSMTWRIARAVIGWLPIGLAIGWLSGELTGCGRFAATCDPGTAPIAWAAQAAVLLVLFALPGMAGWAVVAAAVSLVVALPATLFVTASAGGDAAQAGPSFLGVVLGLAWLGGAVAAAIFLRRTAAGPAGPVS